MKNLKEWQRTVILVMLIVIAAGYIVYLKTGYSAHLEDLLQ